MEECLCADGAVCPSVRCVIPVDAHGQWGVSAGLRLRILSLTSRLRFM